jgi:hypothetical protein
MVFDNGASQLTAYPISQTAKVEDRTALRAAYSGKVIAATNQGGLPPRRTRSLVLRLDDADLAAFLAWFQALTTGTFKWTDTNGRVWDAQWLGDFPRVEDDVTSVGHHRLSVELLLVDVFSDAGTGAYGNADVSQMSVQVSGKSKLNFPLAYALGLQGTEIAVPGKVLAPGFLAVDAGRYTDRVDKTVSFSVLSDQFFTTLEDYLVNTMQGALLPFTLIHFRDGSHVFRWEGGMNWTQDNGLLWAGQAKLRAEV